MKIKRFNFAGSAGVMAALLMTAVSTFAQYTNGIYAEFTTSMGSFTCRLEHALAPKTVANFIGLATGERAWLDETTGVVQHRPLYQNLIFHRVASNFVIQSGSPTGLRTGGPGYQFVDELTPALRHDGPGVLSMANSGPDSNGSQFFITVVARAQLDNVHSVFGRLYGGASVVQAINQVPTDASERPLTNVGLQAVTIRRVGAEAEAFDIHAQGLPSVTNLNLSIARAGTNVSLTFNNRANVENRLFVSTNLTAWSEQAWSLETALPDPGVLHRAVSARQQFFRLAQTQYPTTLFPPVSLLGRTVSLTFTNGAAGVVTINFDANGTGTYSSGNSGNLLGYSWSRDPYNGRLWPVAFDGPLNLDMTLTLNFDRALAGGFKGTVYPAPFFYTPGNPFQYPVSGAFTLSP